MTARNPQAADILGALMRLDVARLAFDQQERASKREVSNRLRGVRLDRGLTVLQVAQRMGLTKAYVSQVETGVRPPTIEFVGRFMAAVNGGR